MVTHTPHAPPEPQGQGPSRTHKARRLALLLVPAAVFIGIFGVYLFRDAQKPVVGSKAPDFATPYLNEPGTFELSSLRGKPVLLNFWASWCVPCEDEAPLLEDAYARYRGDVEFVGVNIRDARDDAIRFVDDYGLSYPQVWDEVLRITEGYGLLGQPETFFVDQDGIVVQHVKGPLEANVLYQYLDVLIGRDA